MPSFNQCPACKSPNNSQFSYQEGTIFCCRDCRLQWASRNNQMFPDIVPNPDSLYMKPESIIDPASYRPYRDFFSFIGQKIRSEKLRILDIGCGSGVFVGLCLATGHEVNGVERDPLLARYMPEHIKKRVKFIAAEEIALTSECYDVITFWDSFEHIDDPFAIISRLSKNLAPGGVIFMRVNNTRDIYNLMVKTALQLNHRIGQRLLKSCFNFPDHVWNFSFAPMQKMLGDAGFEIIHFRADDTPADRLTGNPLLQSLFKLAYLVNKSIKGGKIGEYYIRKTGNSA